MSGVLFRRWPGADTRAQYRRLEGDGEAWIEALELNPAFTSVPEDLVRYLCRDAPTPGPWRVRMALRPGQNSGRWPYERIAP